MSNESLNETFENVENVETVENVEMTATEKKAQNVLRAKLPKMSDLGFNFEKRTGSVFTSTMVTVHNEYGDVVYEDGLPKKKLTRKVVEIEDENGNALPEYVGVMDEIEVKRAAALILTTNTIQGRIDDKITKGQALLDEAASEQTSFNEAIANAESLVLNYDLPAKDHAQRENLTTKLTAAEDKLSKLKAMLTAAGYSDEEINAQLS